MKRIVGFTHTPCITDEDTVARIVKFEDGSAQLQSYDSKHGWGPGGVSLYSMTHAGAADDETLSEEGYTAEEITDILADPTQ